MRSQKLRLVIQKIKYFSCKKECSMICLNVIVKMIGIVWLVYD